MLWMYALSFLSLCEKRQIAVVIFGHFPEECFVID